MSADELGITDEDREKLAELAGRRRGSYSSHHGLPALDNPNVVATREAVERADTDCVKACDLAAGTPMSSYQIGKALSRLELEGVVEKECRGWKAVTWRILD